MRVGIIGLSDDASWAQRAHAPALAALPELELVAVATTRLESARAAAERNNARLAFASAAELAAHPDVDLVVVAMKVPGHDEAIRAALDAGKAVLCEWPLARDTAEAEALVAATNGTRTAIGLQGRFNPAITEARRLIADGYLGELTAVAVHGFLGFKSGYTERQRYRFDPANGATDLAIAGGHTLDTVAGLAGDLGDLTSDLQIRRGPVRFTDSGAEIPRTMADQILIIGRMRAGAAFSLHLQADRVSRPRTVIELTGSEGDLRVESVPGAKLPGIQMQDLRLLGTRERGGVLEPLEFAQSELRQPALAVAALYRAFAAGQPVPDFEHALRLHRVLDSVAGA